jgi:DNA primase
VFLKLIDNALSLIDYRVIKLKEGIDFKNSNEIVKYAENILGVLDELEPIEREVYINKLSEETGIRDQILYDMLNKKFQKNVKKTENVNIDGSFGQKLYLEPAYLKAERVFLKLILKDKEALKYVMEIFKKDELILESHKRIYDYIIENNEYNGEEKEKRIEIRCDDIDTSREWINVLETNLIQEEYDYKHMISYCIKGIKKYKLEESKKNIMNRIKEYEAEGNLDKSLKLAKELIEIQKEIGGI